MLLFSFALTFLPRLMQIKWAGLLSLRQYASTFVAPVSIPFVSVSASTTRFGSVSNWTITLPPSLSPSTDILSVCSSSSSSSTLQYPVSWSNRSYYNHHHCCCCCCSDFRIGLSLSVSVSILESFILINMFDRVLLFSFIFCWCGGLYCFDNIL